jgi:hypothetical protein
MATVEMTFTPLPAHVRTARLVATAVARRSGVAEALLDEVRLAVGEACSRAVEVHREHCPAEPVRVALTGSADRFDVVVTNTAGHGDGEGNGGAAWPAASCAPGGAAGGAGDQAAAAGTAVAGTAAAGTAAAGTAAAGTAAAGTAAVGASAVGAPAPRAGHTAVSHLPPAPPAELGLAVIAGLADDVQVSRTPGGLSIRMSWPCQAPANSAG